ncbi:MAG: type I asparaginase [Clostridia bacterium]|nr:type I asparaginase [Clostridia bacterium]
MKKKVGIIYTGGTIGMMPTESGYAPNPSAFPEMLDKIHDVNLPGFPEYEVICLSRLLDSSDVSYREWSELGGIIAKRYNDFDGFVVLHGTDTMAYTASVMSFILEGLDKAVVFTGSQIPLCRMRSDGIDNLVTSILVAASGRVHEVCLYFGGQLMRGNRVTKVSANGLLAFESPNYPRLADVGTEIAYRSKFLRKSEGGELRLAPTDHVPIAVLKIFPGMSHKLIESLVESGVRAIVIEAFGAGNIPSDKDLAAALKRAEEAGVLIVVTSQCGSGTVSLGTYATSSPLLSAGAVSGQDMTTEAAVAKLYYLFSKYGDTEAVRVHMGTDLAGEMSGEL